MPSVTIVIGKVRSIRSGFTIAFNNAKTRAKITAVLKSAMCTPVNTIDKPYAAAAVTNKRIKKFIVEIFRKVVKYSQKRNNLFPILINNEIVKFFRM